MVKRLQPLLAEETRAVSRTFRWWTGLGPDQLHPRHLSLVSDAGLEALGFFFYLAEAHGAWPKAMAYIVFFLLAKPAGGFRTIGLRTAFYRVGATLRMAIVREWAASVPRAYFAAGTGKSTEDAVCRLMMRAEAADLAEEAVAVLVADVDKCYENVDHQKRYTFFSPTPRDLFFFIFQTP